jgi:hypothetical protein
MSTYINTETSEYPLHEGDIRLLFPEIGDEFVLPSVFAEVPESPLPTLTQTQTFLETTPLLNQNGVYERVYIIRDWTEDELRHNQEQVAYYLAGMPSPTYPNPAPQPEEGTTN